MVLQNKMRIVMQNEMNKYGEQVHSNVTAGFSKVDHNDHTASAGNTNAIASYHNFNHYNDGANIGGNEENSSTNPVQAINSEIGVEPDAKSITGKQQHVHNQEVFQDSNIDFWDTEIPDDDAVFQFLLS